ncbi:transporter [Candidatus Dojkabacteria bacterium]|jgi:hypothetical protein|nr:transporter [Candidatus Dojkabacteria bacterium]
MKKILGLILTVVITLSTITFAFARAGGGEDFGGGGFDSGSSWSGSSSDYSSTGSTSSGSPTISVIVIVIIIIIIIASRKKKGQLGTPGAGQVTSSGGASPTNKSQTSQEISEQLVKLKEIDPDFDEQKFKSHVKKVFMAVQQGWTARDQSICRAFMGEEVYQSHQMQIENMKAQKIINVLKNIVVGSTDFAKIDLGTDFHKIALKVRAQMRDFKVKEDAPDKAISGEVNATEPFTEYWVFIRKSTLKTKVKNGIFDRKCPNCGAPVSVDVAGVCKYCNANVVNGDYDWVLSEIVQSSEWSE